MADLKPCPFCGRDAHDCGYNHSGVKTATCACCFAEDELTHIGWNASPIEDALRAEVEQWKSKAIAQEDYSREVIELRAEVARSQNFAEGLQRELTETIDKWNAEVAALKEQLRLTHADWCIAASRGAEYLDEAADLKAELEKYTGPLTDDEAEGVCSAVCNMLDHWHVQRIDAAIRAARDGAGK